MCETRMLYVGHGDKEVFTQYEDSRYLALFGACI